MATTTGQPVGQRNNNIRKTHTTMNSFVQFLKGFASMAMAVVLFVALIGAVVSTDIVFKIAGILGLGIWGVIFFRSLKHHNISGQGHNNYL